MTHFKLRTAALGIAILGLAAFAAPTTAKAQCPYSGGYGGYYAPSYGYSQSYYGGGGYYGGGYYNYGRPRLRRALTVAAVAGVIVAASNNDNRRRSSRSRYGR